MKKTLLFFTALLIMYACQESMENRAARDAKETTEKRCPIRLNDEGTLILERINFDKITHTWRQDYLLDTEPGALMEADLRDLLLMELKNTPSYKPYMDADFNFQYVYCMMSSPKDTLFNIMLTPKDYRN